jgi:hypothetical protein
MPRSSKRSAVTVVDQVLETPESSVLDLLDSLLNKGVMLNGDVTLGVAGIDLIYLRLSSILCAADRILPRDRSASPRKARRRRPALFKRNP